MPSSQTTRASTVRHFPGQQFNRSFHLNKPGDDDLRSALEDRAESFDNSHYWASHHLRLSVIAHAAIANMAASASKSQEAVNMYEDYLSGRHLSENVEAFLRRLPPLITGIMDYGPWIYCANPYASKGNGPADQATLVRRGRQLLKEFTALKAGIEAYMPGKSKGVVTRQVIHPKLYPVL